MSGPESSNCYSIRHECEGWGFESPSCRDIFCLKNFDTFLKKHPFVNRTWLLMRMHSLHFNVNFITKYLYRQSQYSTTWDSKCLALIAQLVRTFGMNTKVGWSSPLRSRHSLPQKRRHFHKNIRLWSKNECCCQCRGNISIVNFTTRYPPTSNVYT